MPNEKNIVPYQFTGEQSREEAAKNGKKGGIASGVARRKRKAMKTVLTELLCLPANCAEAFAALDGMEADEADNQTAMLAGLLKSAMSGDVKAVQEIRNILGESRDTAAEKAERRARTTKLQAEAAAAQEKAGGRDADSVVKVIIDV